MVENEQIAHLKRVGVRAVTSDGPKKLSVLAAFAKIRSMNIFQGAFFFFLRAPHNGTFVFIHTCLMAAWKEVGELQTVNISL